jgi:agmatinase
MPQESAAEYLRHGQTPFFRLPRAETARPGPGSGAGAYAGADAVLLGVPYDGGTTYLAGARLAPYHVRRVSALVQGWHPVHEIDVFRALNAVDGGNVVFPPFDAAAVRAAVEREAAAVHAAGAVPFVVGGDHTVALPCLRAAAARHGPLAVVHVDAHADTSDARVWGDAYHHGTPLRHALEEGLVARSGLHQIGLRGPWGSPEEGRYAEALGATVHPVEEVEARGLGAVMADVRRAVGAQPLYVTFDVDAVDPAFAPGTGTPVPGGLSSREALQLLRGLAGARLAGMDLVEVSPPLDHADVTAHLAAHLLFEGLALLAHARRERPPLAAVSARR